MRRRRLRTVNWCCKDQVTIYLRHFYCPSPWSFCLLIFTLFIEYIIRRLCYPYNRRVEPASGSATTGIASPESGIVPCTIAFHRSHRIHFFYDNSEHRIAYNTINIFFSVQVFVTCLEAAKKSVWRHGLIAKWDWRRTPKPATTREFQRKSCYSLFFSCRNKLLWAQKAPLSHTANYYRRCTAAAVELQRLWTTPYNTKFYNANSLGSTFFVGRCIVRQAWLLIWTNIFSLQILYFMVRSSSHY